MGRILQDRPQRVSAATAQAAPPTATTGIALRTWQLLEIQTREGAVLVPDDPSRYTLDGSALAIGPIAATRALCPPGSISDRYLAELGQVASWTDRAGTLVLSSRAGDATLKFRPAPTAEAPPAGQLR